MIIVSYLISYIASYLFAASGHYILSGAVLILCAIVLYAADYLRTKNIINLRGLFSLFFVGGEGVSCLKLSYLQTDWEVLTWICLELAFLGVWVAYEFCVIRKNSGKAAGIKGKCIIGAVDRIPAAPVNPDRAFAFIVGLTLVSAAAFAAEAVILGFIPLFTKGVPHAYSYFHISGVHYFTVSCVLIPAMSVIWFQAQGVENLKDIKKISTAKTGIVLACDLAALIIPVLCVSRMQFIFAVAFAVFTYLANNQKKLPVKYIVMAVIVMAAAFALLSIARSHDAEYLNSIFEMKIELPVDVSRVYIYIANNYDNFNCLVRDLPNHTLGLRILFPVWALTGLKFLVPGLVNFPIYVTKEELTTVTLFYDYYYDFGVAGVFIAALVIGLIIFMAERFTIKRCDKAAGLIYSQIALYMVLSFFTTWLSNPTTWFYLAVSGLFYFFNSGRVIRRNKKKRNDKKI